MLSKSERKKILIASAQRLGLISTVAFLMPVSLHEIRETVSETVSPLASQMDDSIDDEASGMRSQLAPRSRDIYESDFDTLSTV